MERTVTLPLDEYNALVKIQATSEQPRKHTVRIISAPLYTEVIETDDDAVEKLAQEIKVLNTKILNTQAVLDSVKKMSCREFRQWKKNL